MRPCINFSLKLHYYAIFCCYFCRYLTLTPHIRTPKYSESPDALLRRPLGAFLDILQEEIPPLYTSASPVLLPLTLGCRDAIRLPLTPQSWTKDWYYHAQGRHPFPPASDVHRADEV